MAKYKTIRIKKRGGGTRLQRVQVLASGKYKFVSNNSNPSKNPRSGKSRRRHNPARKVKKMAKKKSRRRNSFTIPLAPVVGLAAGVAEPLMNIVSDPQTHLMPSLNHLAAIYTGYNPMEGKFQPDMLARGLLPLVMGVLIHKFVGGPPLNLNRTLAAANVPILRI